MQDGFDVIVFELLLIDSRQEQMEVKVLNVSLHHCELGLRKKIIVLHFLRLFSFGYLRKRIVNQEACTDCKRFTKQRQI